VGNFGPCLKTDTEEMLRSRNDTELSVFVTGFGDQLTTPDCRPGLIPQPVLQGAVQRLDTALAYQSAEQPKRLAVISQLASDTTG
jgi:hypothetical protein